MCNQQVSKQTFSLGKFVRENKMATTGPLTKVKSQHSLFVYSNALVRGKFDKSGIDLSRIWQYIQCTKTPTAKRTMTADPKRESQRAYDRDTGLNFKKCVFYFFFKHIYLMILSIGTADALAFFFFFYIVI